MILILKPPSIGLPPYRDLLISQAATNYWSLQTARADGETEPDLIGSMNLVMNGGAVPVIAGAGALNVAGDKAVTFVAADTERMKTSTPITTKQVWSWSGWYNSAAALSGNGPMFFQFGNDGVNNYIFLLHRDDMGGLCLQLSDGSGAKFIDPGSYQLGDGNWHHVALTRAYSANNSLDTWTIYVDGVQVAQNNSQALPLTAANTNSSALISFAGRTDGDANCMSADIAHEAMKIGGVVWTPAEIAAQYAYKYVPPAVVGSGTGYIAGGNGNTSGTLPRTDINRFSFPTDTRSVLAATSGGGSGATSNRGTAGYTGTTPINKLNFTTEAISTTGASLVSGRFGYPANIQNRTVAGYWCAGYPGPVSAIQRLSHTADTLSTLGATLATPHHDSGGFSNESVAGYEVGGALQSSPYALSQINKIPFPAETCSLLGATIASMRTGLNAGFSNDTVAGYSAGGAYSVAEGTVDKIAYATDTRTTLVTGVSFSTQTYVSAGMTQYQAAGYCCGGAQPGGSPCANIDRFAFPTDTRTSLAIALTSVRYGATGWSN